MKDLIDSHLAASGYCIKPGYQFRDKPEDGEGGVATGSPPGQPLDVYRFAGFLAKRFGGESVLDMGCGLGEKFSELLPELKLVHINYLEKTRRAPPFSGEKSGREQGRAEQPLRLEDRDLVRRSIVVCPNVIERVRDPMPLLATLNDLLQDAPVAILTTPERDRIRGLHHMGPPVDMRTVREWSLPELERLLRGAGLKVEFIGLATANDEDKAKSSILAILSKSEAGECWSAPAQFRVLAVMCAYNEEDVIEGTLQYLIAQGVDVHLVDNWSTDRTVERAQPFLGRGLARITKFPAAGPSPTFDLHALLTNVEEISFSSQADWIIHYDADELRESPWPGVRLRDAFYHVDREGFNAIDHTCLVFHPTGDPAEDPASLFTYKYFEFGKRSGHFLQVKAWKRQSVRAGLADIGGHAVDFPGRRIYPYKFLLRHYPVRSQEHGIRKILHERKLRWNQQERQTKGWHTQYDHIDSHHDFLRNPSQLIQFNPESFPAQYLVERVSGIGIERT